MTGRLDQQPESTLASTVAGIESDLRELKTGAQYAEAKMFEYSSAGAYDLSGALASSSGGNQIVLKLTVTATSTDGTAFLSGFVPQLWVPDTGSLYYDTLVSSYELLYSQAVTTDPTVVVYWLILAARSSVSASSFRFKARLYATSPVTVTFARTT